MIPNSLEIKKAKEVTDIIESEGPVGPLHPQWQLSFHALIAQALADQRDEVLKGCEMAAQNVCFRYNAEADAISALTGGFHSGKAHGAIHCLEAIRFLRK